MGYVFPTGTNGKKICSLIASCHPWWGYAACCFSLCTFAVSFPTLSPVTPARCFSPGLFWGTRLSRSPASGVPGVPSAGHTNFSNPGGRLPTPGGPTASKVRPPPPTLSTSPSSPAVALFPPYLNLRNDGSIFQTSLSLDGFYQHSALWISAETFGHSILR